MASDKIIYNKRAICSSFNISNEMLLDMVSWGIASPSGSSPDKWLFSHSDYERIGRAIRFNKDLDINVPGAALALELLDELGRIRNSIRH